MEGEYPKKRRLYNYLDLGIAALNRDVFVGIVCNLDYTTLLSVPFVCMQWSKWVQDEPMWKQIANVRYPSLSLLSPDASKAIESWKSLYTSRLKRDDLFTHFFLTAYKSISKDRSKKNIDRFERMQKQLKDYSSIYSSYEPSNQWSSETRFLIDGMISYDFQTDLRFDQGRETYIYKFKATLLGLDGKFHSFSFVHNFTYNSVTFEDEIDQCPCLTLDNTISFSIVKDTDMNESEVQKLHTFIKLCQKQLQTNIPLKEFWDFIRKYWILKQTKRSVIFEEAYNYLKESFQEKN